MRVALLVLIVTACKQDPAEPLPEPVAPAPAVAVPAPRQPTPAPAPAASPAIDGIALATRTCEGADLHECNPPDLPKQLPTVELAGCGAATAVELRQNKQFTPRCVLALRRTYAVDVVEALAICPDGPRVHLERVTCAGDQVDVELAVAARKATTKLHVQCHRAAASTSCVRERVVPPADPRVAALLAEVKNAVEHHRWSALLALCSPEHRKAQMGELGQSEPAYLAEILGLHSEDNSLGDGDVTLAALAKISTLEVLDVADAGDGAYEVIGVVTLAGHAPLRLELLIVTEHGQLQLGGGVG